MTVKVPPTWNATQYTRFIRLETSGRQAVTHLAAVKQPDGKPCRAYVKHYPVHYHRGLFNEWFGHIVLSALGVPQPPAAILPAPVPGTNTLAWAFCSMEPSPAFEGTAKYIYNIANPAQYQALIKRLFEDCEHLLPGLIAADQLLLHADRNIGNIAFTGKKTFVAIDAGGILCGADCPPERLLYPAGWVRSKLIEDLVPLTKITPKLSNALIAAAQCTAEQFYAHHGEITSAINYRGNRDASICFDALWWRTLDLEAIFRTHLNALI